MKLTKVSNTCLVRGLEWQSPVLLLNFTQFTFRPIFGIQGCICKQESCNLMWPSVMYFICPLYKSMVFLGHKSSLVHCWFQPFCFCIRGDNHSRVIACSSFMRIFFLSLCPRYIAVGNNVIMYSSSFSFLLPLFESDLWQVCNSF